MVKKDQKWEWIERQKKMFRELKEKFMKEPVLVASDLNKKMRIKFDVLSGIVHTRGESSQDGLRDMQTYRITLASAYVLYCLSAIWSQFLMEGRSLKWN